MEVQDGASETMRNSTERFALWRVAMIHENSKDQSRDGQAKNGNAKSAR
jgi:hypothetical protein